MNIDPKSETQEAEKCPKCNNVKSNKPTWCFDMFHFISDNPDKEHFDKMLLKELTWKLDREVWAHVPNPSPNEEWSTSKAREETRNLISEYIGNYDALQSENQALRKQNEELVSFLRSLHDGPMSWDDRKKLYNLLEKSKPLNHEQS